MQANNQFSIQRFMMLIKQSLRVNKKTIGISLAGISGTLFILLILFQKMSSFEDWTNQSYFKTFWAFFFIFGIIYSSLSFPAFRSKEKSIAYLTLPVSTSEKFIFELLTRIVGFIILMPLLYWIIANVEGSIIHYYFPSLANYKFSFHQAFTESSNKQVTGWVILSSIQSCLFVFIAVFTGASHFQKSPLVKTLFTFSAIVIGYLLFIYLLFKGLNLESHVPSNGGVLFIRSKEGAIAFFAIAATVVNLSLLAIAWFRLKEREV